MLDDLMGAPIQKEERTPPNPTAAKTEKSHPSAPISEKQSKVAEGTVKVPDERPSVREELREIRAKQQEAAAPSIDDPSASKRSVKQQTTTHKQPRQKRKQRRDKPCMILTIFLTPPRRPMILTKRLGRQRKSRA